MENIKLYRRRYIPDEKILLKDDTIIYLDVKKNIIITKWNTLKPRKDFSKGYSCYYIDKNLKISKMYKEDGSFLYTYCDVIETIFDKEENSYLFNDLLIDVIIYEDGFVKVLDLGEIPIVLEDNLITLEQVKTALLVTDNLLKIIYSDKFESLTKILDDFILSNEKN